MRLRQIHVINCSSYLDRIMAIVRPFMRKEVSKLVNIIRYFPLENTTKKFISTCAAAQVCSRNGQSF